jgi:hypothetical protein
MLTGKFPYFKQKSNNMPDITMCKGGSCMLRLSCHRYTATAEPLGQSYFSEPPYKVNMMLDENHAHVGVVTLACPMFWNNEKYKKDEQKPTN